MDRTGAVIDPGRHDAVLFDLDTVVAGSAAAGRGEGEVVASGAAVALAGRLRLLDVGVAVFSSMRDCRGALEAAGIAGLFDAFVDGEPGEAVLGEAARRLGVEPARVVVAGDPGALVIAAAERRLSGVPDALARWEGLAAVLGWADPAVFLDFDGTLAPIVEEPGAAAPTAAARAAVARLAGVCPVAVVSGRGLDDVRARLDVDGLWYAGSHGFELEGPAGQTREHDQAGAALGALDAAEEQLRERLRGVPGAAVERKPYAVAAHYRRVDPERRAEVAEAVEEVAPLHPGLRTSGGRAVAELRPDVDWDKGRALRWVLEHLPAAGRPLLPVYAGDDLTDEDALRAVAGDGIGIVVRSEEHGDRTTAATLAVDGVDALAALLDRVADVQAAKA